MEEEEGKGVFDETRKRRRAQRELDCLLKQFHGRKSILQLLPAIRLRCSSDVLTVALERVERRRDALTMEDLVFLENFKSSLQAKKG